MNKCQCGKCFLIFWSVWHLNSLRSIQLWYFKTGNIIRTICNLFFKAQLFQFFTEYESMKCRDCLCSQWWHIKQLCSHWSGWKSCPPASDSFPHSWEGWTCFLVKGGVSVSSVNFQDDEIPQTDCCLLSVSVFTSTHPRVTLKWYTERLIRSHVQIWS